MSFTFTLRGVRRQGRAPPLRAGSRSSFQSATQHINLFVYSGFCVQYMLRRRISTTIAHAGIVEEN
ncbi:hypothetical protein, partial [Leptospira weilii]|uniref:hypothetical protein n=1 Tax=Leptospira weilii TaxID=28184 RepID=UPI000774437A